MHNARQVAREIIAAVNARTPGDEIADYEAIMNRCECGKYCAGATRVLHRAERSGIAAVADEVLMAYENCPADDMAALRSIESRVDDGTARPEVAEYFDMSEAHHFLHPDR